MYTAGQATFKKFKFAVIRVACSTRVSDKGTSSYYRATEIVSQAELFKNKALSCEWTLPSSREKIQITTPLILLKSDLL